MKTFKFSWLTLILFIISIGFVQAQNTTKDNLQNAKLYGDETINTPIGQIVLKDNYIAQGSQALFDDMDYQRACQAYIWSTPAVSYKQWQTAQAKTFDAYNLGDFVVYKSLLEKRGIVTANLTTPYVINFTSLKKGAIMVKIPAGQIAGMFMDVWQRPVSDIGLTGPDQGKGATYIVVGPEEDKSKYEGKADYIIQSATNNLFIGIRLIDPSPEFEKKVAQEMKVALVGQPLKPIRFIKGVNKEWSGTAPRGMAYWKLVNQFIQEEPTREQDKAWTAMLEPLGIKKGQDFKPDERQTKILTRGVAMGELMARNLQTTPRMAQPYWENTNWYKCFDFTVSQETKNKIELDERVVWFYEAVTSSKGMVTPTVGKGQVYMTSKKDSKGNWLRGDKTYKLHIPKDVPIKQFWSVTLYSENTRRPYSNGGTKIKDGTLGSKSKQLQYNKDGSVDIYIGAKAPKGKESNYLKTIGDDGWFVYFRLYAPTEPFFNKSFSLPDWEMID